MAFPVRAGAADPGPDRHSPPSRWGDLLAGMIAEGHAARLAVEEMAARPHDDRAVELAASILAVMELQADTARRGLYDEQRIAAEVAERVEEALAAHGLRGGRLRAL